MISKLYSVRLINELESIVAVRVFYGNELSENIPIYEEFPVKINHAHLFEKIEDVKGLLQSNSSDRTLQERIQQVEEDSTTILGQQQSSSKYYIDKIQVFLGEGKEEKMYTFTSPFLTHDSNKETFVISRDKKGEVELRLHRDKEMKTKYDYSEVLGSSSDDIIGF